MKIIIRKPLAFSEIGRKDNQEDDVFPVANELNVENRFFILCDGMGGHDNGEVASNTICRSLGHYFEINKPFDDIVTAEYFNEALAFAYDELDKKDNGSAKKMGTTMTCLYFHRNGYLVAHIGDSRIYHVRPASADLKNGRLGILYQSSDHSLVNDLLKAGELSEEEAMNFPQKNIITRAMQPNLDPRHKADVFSFSDVQSGDYFFLCSDGVLEQLSNEKLSEILIDNSTSDEEKLEAIHHICFDKTRDNFTCYLIPIDKVITEDDDVCIENESIIAGVVSEECESIANKTSLENTNDVSTAQNTSFIKKYSSLKKCLLISLCVLASLLIAIVVMIKDKCEKGDEVKESPVKFENIKFISAESEVIDSLNLTKIRKDTIKEK